MIIPLPCHDFKKTTVSRFQKPCGQSSTLTWAPSRRRPRASHMRAHTWRPPFSRRPPSPEARRRRTTSAPSPTRAKNLAPEFTKLPKASATRPTATSWGRRHRGLRVEASTARLILLAVAAASSGSCKPITATKTTDAPQRGHRHGRPHLRPRHHPPSAASETCAPPPNSPCARTLRTGLRPCLLARASRR